MKHIINNFIGRLYRIYIVNTPRSLQFPAKVIKNLTKSEFIHISHKSIPKKIFEHTNKL